MKRIAIRTGACLAAVALATTAGFTEVTDLRVSKSGNDVILEWTTGTSPYRVIRSLTAVFMSGNTSVADGVVTGGATDAGALLAAESYFYQVLGTDEPNPPLYDLNPPRPVPAITMLTPVSGQPGTSVTIDGINFADFGSGQIVMFGDQPADVQSSTPTQITAIAPPGTVTSDVGVCVVDVCSNKVRFTVSFGPTFQSIGSLAFEPGTGSLWLGDRGTADDVVEVDSAGTAIVRASHADPYVSNVSPGDGSGRIYFSSQGLGVGGIRYINSADNSNVFFRNAGTTVDQVGARAMAANDSEFNVAYFLDGNLDTVRRVPLVGTIDTNWGNTTLSFNIPSGARFDSAGNLYVSSMSSIYRIAPDQTVTLLASGFTNAAGLDLSEATGIPVLLVADEGAGVVYLVNGEDGSKESVGGSFNAPQAAVFSENPANGELYYDVAEPTRIVRLPDPRVQFALGGEEIRVLIHKYRTDDVYPTASQTEDRKIVVEATVVEKARPAAGVTVYFRLTDPKDKALYASTGAGDNKGGPGNLSATSATSDADGKVRTVLTVTDTYAGDNYQVEASLQPEPNLKKIARSGVFTAWKRAYVEYDRMYKIGQFINQTSGPGHPVGMPDATKVFVVTPGTFSAGDQVHVLSGTSDATVIGEMRTVMSVAADHLVLDSALTNVYENSGGNPPNDVFPYGFVARVADGAYDIAPTPQALPRRSMTRSSSGGSSTAAACCRLGR